MEMTGQLEGRRILLTGVSRGIGLCAARLFLREGAQVIGVARNPTRLQEVSRELSQLGPFSHLHLSLEAPSAPAAVALHVSELWGALDVVVHNASVMVAHGALSEEPDGALETSLDVNLLAPFRLTRALLPLLRRGQRPRVVNVSSGAGTHHGLTEPGIAAYRLSKWALNGLTLLQAEEHRGRISVLAFDPGWVKTDLGGPQAPGEPEESAHLLLATLALPWDKTGSFHKGSQEIPW